MLGVHKNTVKKYREKLESTSQIMKLDKLEGADGKKRPAEKLKTVTAKTEENEGKAQEINLARRHLNQNQKEELIKGQLKDTPKKSNNQIAKMLGVSDDTVKKYREELESASQIRKVDKLEGADGKEYPAEKETEADESSRKSEKNPKTIPTRPEKGNGETPD